MTLTLAPKRLMIKNTIKKVLWKLGYDIIPIGYPGWQLDYLQRLGFTPGTLVDVGVGFGSPGPQNHVLYETFPEAHLVLIEPLREFEPIMRNILSKYQGEYFQTALGSKEEPRVMTIEQGHEVESSIYERNPELQPRGMQLLSREVSVTRLDTLLKKHGFEPPFGLKIDVEGFELEVIRGATTFLKQTQLVIAEVSVPGR